MDFYFDPEYFTLQLHEISSVCWFHHMIYRIKRTYVINSGIHHECSVGVMLWERRPRRDSRLEAAPTAGIYAMIGFTLTSKIPFKENERCLKTRISRY
jgi:hypothetical protein